MNKIDLNCDMGESFGAYTIGNDHKILEYITSANIACGFHAGDPHIMYNTVKMALENNVAIGAHVGFMDLVGFGRRNMDISPKEAYDLVVYQIGALYAFVKAEGGKMKHVKPHGALYNMAAKDEKLAEAIADAVYKVDSDLILYGLSGSKLVDSGKKRGLKVYNEVFADRTYTEEGRLTPRGEENALISDEDKAISQVITMVRDGKVISTKGTIINIKADTICIHGDGEHALSFAKNIKNSLMNQGIILG